jgi:hypothetical protein
MIKALFIGVSAAVIAGAPQPRTLEAAKFEPRRIMHDDPYAAAFLVRPLDKATPKGSIGIRLVSIYALGPTPLMLTIIGPVGGVAKAEFHRQAHPRQPGTIATEPVDPAIWRDLVAAVRQTPKPYLAAEKSRVAACLAKIKSVHVAADIPLPPSLCEPMLTDGYLFSLTVVDRGRLISIDNVAGDDPAPVIDVAGRIYRAVPEILAKPAS